MKDYQAKSTLAMAIRAVLWGMPLVITSFTTTAIYAANVHPISISLFLKIIFHFKRNRIGLRHGYEMADGWKVCWVD